MQIFASKGLVFLAVPRTGSTSVESALKHAADPPIKRRHFPKHIPARAFFRRWKRHFPEGPELDAFAVIRHPVDRLKSWYRYRCRSQLAGSEKSTTEVTFEEFVDEYLRHDRRPFADIGNQHRFCTDEAQNILIKHLFSFENILGLEDFLRTEIGLTGALPRLNATPGWELDLSRKTLARLEKANALEFDLYERVNASGRVTIEPTNPI